jgi:hypothetical protein
VALMGGWSGQFLTEPLPGSDTARLATQPRYTAKDGFIYELLPGFVSDGSSVPRLLWTLVGHPRDPDWEREGYLHDALCRSGWFPIKFCDRLMVEALTVSGCPQEKREAIDHGLAISRAWRRKRPVDPLAGTYLQVSFAG